MEIKIRREELINKFKSRCEECKKLPSSEVCELCKDEFKIQIELLIGGLDRSFIEIKELNKSKLVDKPAILLVENYIRALKKNIDEGYGLILSGQKVDILLQIVGYILRKVVELDISFKFTSLPELLDLIIESRRSFDSSHLLYSNYQDVNVLVIDDFSGGYFNRIDSTTLIRFLSLLQKRYRAHLPIFFITCLPEDEFNKQYAALGEVLSKCDFIEFDTTVLKDGLKNSLKDG